MSWAMHEVNWIVLSIFPLPQLSSTWTHVGLNINNDFMKRQ